MVMRTAILTLITVLHPILVHGGNYEEFDVAAKPSPVLSIGENGGHEPFQAIARHRFASVMAGRNQHPVIRLALEFAKMQEFNWPPFSGAA